MKKNLVLASVLAVMGLGIASAQGAIGHYVDYPVVVKDEQSSMVARAGDTTYFQIDQMASKWGLDADSIAGAVYVGSDGYIPSPTKTLEDAFWVLDEGTPAGWAIYIPKSEATLQGKLRNTYAIRIPSGVAAGSYNLVLKVRYNETGEIGELILTVTVQ